MQEAILDLTGSPTLPTSPGGVLRTVDQLLRDTRGVLERIRRGEDLLGLARAMVFTIAAGAGVFGAAMGAYRGGVQIGYAAVKLPAVILLTMAVVAPALTALNSALGRTASLRRDLALVLCCLALSCLVLAAQTPVVLLAVEVDVSYHSLILLVVACCVVAGGVGLSLFLRGLRLERGHGLWAVAVGMLGVFMLAAGQMSWTLRPFLVRPRTGHAPFVRSLEGSLVEAVLTSTRSARGLYYRQSAPLPEEESP